jgi:hypothetical protein
MKKLFRVRNTCWWESPPAILVRLECTGDMVDETTVKFENIEEDISGRDVLTFECPICKQSHKSMRFGR